MTKIIAEYIWLEKIHVKKQVVDINEGGWHNRNTSQNQKQTMYIDNTYDEICDCDICTQSDEEYDKLQIFKSTTRIVDGKPYMLNEKIVLIPYVIAKDPFRNPAKDYLIFCYLRDKDNARNKCIEIIKSIKSSHNTSKLIDLSLTFTQNITFVDNFYHTLSATVNDFTGEIGYQNNKLKEVIDKILENCLIIDIDVIGYTMSKYSSSCSFQIGSKKIQGISISSCDDLTIFRYVAMRTSRCYNFNIILGEYVNPETCPNGIKQKSDIIVLTNSCMDVEIYYSLTPDLMQKNNLIQQLKQSHSTYINMIKQNKFACNINPNIWFYKYRNSSDIIISQKFDKVYSHSINISRNFEVLQRNYDESFDNQIIIKNENVFVDKRNFSDANPYLILLNLLEQFI